MIHLRQTLINSVGDGVGDSVGDGRQNCLLECCCHTTADPIA